MYNNKAQKMGSGTTTRYIEIDITPTTTETTSNLQTLLKTDGEFIQYLERYEFVRINKVIAVIPPCKENGELLILARWNVESSTDDISTCDSTKRIAMHTIKYRKQTFLPPNLPVTTIYTDSEGSKAATINLAGYNSTDTMYLKVTQESARIIFYPLRIIHKLTFAQTNFSFRIILKCTFRGEKYTTSLNKLIKFKDDPTIQTRLAELIKQDNIQKLENEKKEEEEKEEREEKEEEEQNNIINQEQENNFKEINELLKKMKINNK